MARLRVLEEEPAEPSGALLARVTDPFTVQPGAERYAQPAPEGFTETFRTFCGT